MALETDPAIADEMPANGDGKLRQRGAANGAANGAGPAKAPLSFLGPEGHATPGSEGAKMNVKTLEIGAAPWPLSRYFRWEFLLGCALSVNFMLFWAVPIAAQGQLWKYLLKPVFQPMYDALDRSSTVRWFAETYVYEKAQHADFFVTLLLVCMTTAASVGSLFWMQWNWGHLPWWSILIHYLAWWVPRERVLRRLGLRNGALSPPIVPGSDSGAE